MHIEYVYLYRYMHVYVCIYIYLKCTHVEIHLSKSWGQGNGLKVIFWDATSQKLHGMVCFQRQGLIYICIYINAYISMLDFRELYTLFIVNSPWFVMIQLPTVSPSIFAGRSFWPEHWLFNNICFPPPGRNIPEFFPNNCKHLGWE